MNKEQESRFGMALKVKNFHSKNQTALAVIPAVMPYFTELKTKITALILADSGSRLDVSGYAVGKSMQRQSLEQQVQNVANAVASYSVVNKDPILQKKADFPKSAWYNFTEEELVTQATIVKNLALPLATALTVYGATAVQVNGLAALIDTFADVISNPSLAIDQKKDDNERVVVILDEIKTLLTDKLDVLMRSFEVNNPSLYSLYLSARAIDSNGYIMIPTVVSDVPPASLKAVHTVGTYSPDTFYTIQNLSTQAVFFSLSSLENTAGTEEVLLNEGETRSRLAENLASSGTFLIVRNPGATAANVKIWVE